MGAVVHGASHAPWNMFYLGVLRRTGVLLCAVAIACGTDDNGGVPGSPDAGGAGLADASNPTPDAPGSIDAAPISDAAATDANSATADATVATADAAPPPPQGSLLSPPYLMWVTPSEVSVRWETDTAVVGRVDFGQTAALGSSVIEPAATTVHEVRLTGMSANTLHHYRIGWDVYALPVKTFHTAPAPTDTTPFTFVVWGDNQNGPSNFSGLIPHMNAESPRFAMSTGDCVQNGTRSEYRSQLFEPITPLADHVPFLIAAGNHERYSDSNSVLFEEYMSQPGDEHCFGWRYGPLYIVFIDTEDSIDPGSPQATCISDALTSTEATTATWQMAAFHKPPRIEWWFGGAIAFTNEMEAPWVRQTLEPMLESLGVDLVFNGHNHLYAHTPETPGGITWVTTGGGGGSLDTDFFLWDVGDWPQIMTTLHIHHFLAVDVTASAVTVRAVDTSGTTVHQFTLAP